VLCTTENGWKLLNSPEPSPINSSILAPKSMEHVNTNQGSIGITNRRNPPVLMSAKSVKKSSWRPQTHSEEESIQYTDGNEILGFIPMTERNPADIHFRLIVWIDSHSERAGRKRRGPRDVTILAGERLFEFLKYIENR
jgi:hypothetical protein